MDTILEFIKTGSLGPVRLGMTSEEIVNAIGEPEDISVKTKPYVIWKYGSLQITFDTTLDKPVVTSIFVYFWPDEKTTLPDGVRLRGWVPDSETAIDEFIEKMLSEGIELAKNEQHSMKVVFSGEYESICYISIANVHVLFGVDFGSSYLSKISICSDYLK